MKYYESAVFECVQQELSRRQWNTGQTMLHISHITALCDLLGCFSRADFNLKEKLLHDMCACCLSHPSIYSSTHKLVQLLWSMCIYECLYLSFPFFESKIMPVISSSRLNDSHVKQRWQIICELRDGAEVRTYTKHYIYIYIWLMCNSEYTTLSSILNFMTHI
jgi:hypothetical protein